MRTLTITLVAAFVFLFAQQLTASPPGLDREESGASQAVVAGTIGCFIFDGELNAVALTTRAGLGVIGLVPDSRDLAQAVDLSEECADLIPSLAEQVPHRICEIGNQPDRNIEAFNFVCTGRADRVISAVGQMAKVVTRLGQP